MPAADGSESTIAETTSYCNMCRKWKPIDEFRFRNREKNERHPQCNACLAGYQRGYRDNKRKRQLKKYVDELATDPSDPGSLGAKTRTDAVLKAMLLRFGGLERFADDWFQFQTYRPADFDAESENQPVLMGYLIASFAGIFANSPPGRTLL